MAGVGRVDFSPPRSAFRDSSASIPFRQSSSMAVDGYPTGITDEGQDDEPAQSQTFGIAELRESQGHPFVPRGGLVFVRSEKPVPPGDVEAVVAVGLTDDHGMVHPVHVGRYDQQPKHPVNGYMPMATTISRGWKRSPVVMS